MFSRTVSSAERGQSLAEGIGLVQIGRRVGDVFTIEDNPPLIGGFETGQRAQQGCFATTVGAKKKVIHRVGS